MARRIINIGSSPNAKDGDIIRDAFNKTNQNFEELYALTGGTVSALTELAQDYAAEMFINATHSGVVLTYDDANNKLSISTNFDGNYNNLSNKPGIPADVSELTDTTGLLGGNGVTVIAPDTTEIPGIATLVFTGAGVSVSSVGNAVTLDITGNGNANTGDFAFTATDLSVPIGQPMTLSTYQSGGNKESKLTLTTAGLSSLDVGNNLRVRVGNGTGFEKDWTFNAVGGLQFPDATTQFTAFTGDKLFNGVYNFTLASNGNITFPDNLSYYNDGTLDTSIFQKSVTSETNDTVGSRVYLTYNEVGLEQYLDPNGLNNNQYGRVQVSGNGIRLEVSQELVGTTAYSRLDIAPTGMALSSTDGVSTHTYLFDGNTIVLPNDGIIQQRNSFTRTTDSVVSAATPTVVWTSAVDYISSAKLVIQVECDEVGDLTGWHSQACEAIIACRGYANVYGGSGGDPQMIVYGVVHTSVDPLVTFTVQRNPTTRMVEVVGTPTASASNGAAVKIHSIEMSTRD